MLIFNNKTSAPDPAFPLVPAKALTSTRWAARAAGFLERSGGDRAPQVEAPSGTEGRDRSQAGAGRCAPRPAGGGARRLGDPGESAAPATCPVSHQPGAAAARRRAHPDAARDRRPERRRAPGPLPAESRAAGRGESPARGAGGGPAPRRALGAADLQAAGRAANPVRVLRAGPGRGRRAGRAAGRGGRRLPLAPGAAAVGPRGAGPAAGRMGRSAARGSGAAAEAAARGSRTAPRAAPR